MKVDYKILTNSSSAKTITIFVSVSLLNCVKLLLSLYTKTLLLT